MIRGRIIKGIGGFYYIDCKGVIYECRGRGILRKNKQTPIVGDFVNITITDEDKQIGVLESIEERNNVLIRPPVSNIDKAVIIFAAQNPSPNLSLLDRFIVLAEKEDLEIVIGINKIDLDKEKKYKEILEIYETVGYKVIPYSVKTKEGIEELKKELEGFTSVFAGASGVGKSSTLNSIDSRLNLKTGEVSEKIERGRHTTRHAELMKIDENTWVADTPGFSSLSLDHIKDDHLKEFFIEFDSLSSDCRFKNNCLHEKEPECKVKENVELGLLKNKRYESYIQLLNEIRKNKKRCKF